MKTALQRDADAWMEKYSNPGDFEEFGQKEAFMAGAKAQREIDAKLVDSFEERRWRTLGQGGDISACSLPNLAKAMRGDDTPLRQETGACAMCGALKEEQVIPPKTKLRHRCEALDAQGLTMTDGDECPECGEKFPTRQVRE